MSKKFDIDAEEAARKRQFHGHTSVLVANLESAYMAAGYALIHARMDDSVTREALADMMNKLSTMASQAKRLRDMED